MPSISKSGLLQPSRLILLYVLSLSITFLFVDRVGRSTMIDELVLLIVLPFAVRGILRSAIVLDLPGKLIMLYFFVVALSSLATVISRDGIPLLAPITGIFLDAKFIIFFGALVYLSQRSRKSNEDMVVDICRIIVCLSLIHSVFFVRDIFSNGTSLAGIALRPSNLFGYVPIGLFSHKLYAAAISSLGFASAITLYLTTRKPRYLWASVLFVVLLFLSSSMKELGVLIAVLLIVIRSLSNQKNKISAGSKKIIFTGFILFPFLAFIFGAELDRLIASRIDVYLVEENARAALHVKSAEIAGDYFPFGSGAGTFASQPSRSLYFSPLYYEYGMTFFYGATEEHSSFLMDVGWPKFLAEAGWIGGGAYFLSYLIALLGLIVSFFRRPNSINVFGVLLGALIFSSALGSAVFTGDVGLMICALLFFCRFLDRKRIVGTHGKS